jgi:hypothetical protein
MLVVKSIEDKPDELRVAKRLTNRRDHVGKGHGLSGGLGREAVVLTSYDDEAKSTSPAIPSVREDRMADKIAWSCAA